MAEAQFVFPLHVFAYILVPENGKDVDPVGRGASHEFEAKFHHHVEFERQDHRHLL